MHLSRGKVIQQSLLCPKNELRIKIDGTQKHSHYVTNPPKGTQLYAQWRRSNKQEGGQRAETEIDTVDTLKLISIKLAACPKLNFRFIHQTNEFRGLVC